MSGSGFEHVLKSLAKTLKVGGGHASGSGLTDGQRRQPLQSAVVAGSDELDELLDKLTVTTTTPAQKIAAAELIRASIEDTTVSSIPEIWYSARSLIVGSSTGQMPECRRAGLRLMISCIAHDEHSVGARISYYKTIIKYSSLHDFDLQLEALRVLTNDGRELLDLYQSGFPLPKVLSGKWLEALAMETQDIRVGRKKDLTLPWGTSTEENLHNLIRFIIKTLKFNVAAYEERDLETLLTQAVNICRTTSNVQDVSLCMEIIDTVMVYGIIPLNSLYGILEILCGINMTIDMLAQRSWDSVFNLTKSHMGNNTVLALCRVLESTHRKEVNSNTVRGAAKFLQKLLSDSETRERLSLPMSMVLTSYRKSLDIDSVRHSLEVCGCIYDIVTSESTAHLVDYDVWKSSEFSPFEIFFQISRMGPVRELGEQRRRRGGQTAIAAAAVASVTFGTNSEEGSSQSPVAKIIEIFELMLQYLAKSIESKSFSGPEDSAVTFFIEMSLFLTDDLAYAMVGFFGSMHYCNPMSASWQENTLTLLTNFLFEMVWSPRVRLAVLDIMRSIYVLSGPENTTVVRDLAKEIFSLVDACSDEQTMVGLLQFFEFVCQDCDYELFTLISDILMRQFASHWVQTGSKDLSHATKCRLVARSMATLFSRVFRVLPRRARYLYFNLVSICQRVSEPAAFIEAARILCRIRSTSTNEIFLSEPINIQDLANKVERYNVTIDDNTLWSYPDAGAQYMQDQLDNPSTVLLRSITGRELDVSSYRLNGNQYEIDPAMLLNVFANILESGADWEVYSFVWVHIPPQLSNLKLFEGCSGEILRMRKVICEQVSSSKLPQLVHPPDSVSRHDVSVLGVYAIYMLVAYGDILSKIDYDYIVQSLVLGLSSWEKASTACIHALVVCCYECPLSIKKFLGQVFSKFQTKITTTASSPYVLEFLHSLSRLPWLTDNFTLDEYKRVFGIAFTYIRHANDMSRNQSADGTDKVMSQYLIAIAYSSISRWFLTMKMKDREEMASFITRNLILADGKPDTIDEQSMATLDLISRFTYSNADLVLPKLKTGSASSDSTKRWLYGKTVLSIEVDAESGDGQLVIRRPTGTSVLNITPDFQMYEGDLSSELFAPSFYLLQIAPSDPKYVNPIRIPNDPAMDRAIAAIDRAPVVDFHKISVLYMDRGQHDELEILRNESGSPSYRKFLSSIGELVPLKGTQLYTGGLDTTNDTDGEYAYSWKDKITQVIFHTATLMPTQENDTNLAFKKRHIGNNFVAIFFDESGRPFNFDIIKSQFNFISIVVSPHTQFGTSVAQKGGDNNHNNNNGSGGPPIEGRQREFFQVRAYTKPGIPPLFAACTLKVVSRGSLPVFVRNLAIIASKFATVYHSGGQYVSNWRYRLQQINQLHERVAQVQRQKESSSDNLDDDRDERSGGGPSERDLPLLKALDFTSFS